MNIARVLPDQAHCFPSRSAKFFGNEEHGWCGRRTCRRVFRPTFAHGTTSVRWIPGGRTGKAMIEPGSFSTGACFNDSSSAEALHLRRRRTDASRRPPWPTSAAPTPALTEPGLSAGARSEYLPTTPGFRHWVFDQGSAAGTFFQAAPGTTTCGDSGKLVVALCSAERPGTFCCGHRGMPLGHRGRLAWNSDVRTARRARGHPSALAENSAGRAADAPPSSAGGLDPAFLG